MQRENKSKRAKERTILEAFQAVKRWRKIYYERRCSLEEAAIEVNIPKKTLEDYNLIFNKLKITQDNIQYFRNLKMGTLRNQIKNKRQNEQQQIELENNGKYSPQQFSPHNNNQINIQSVNELQKNWSDMEIIMDDPKNLDQNIKIQGNQNKKKKNFLDQNDDDSPMIPEDD